ncbi:hypothetical protein SUDANB58_05229 [Streptomyces sp. enrichment culture]
MTAVREGAREEVREETRKDVQEETFTALRTQLQEAAEAFAGGPDALRGILLGLVELGYEGVSIEQVLEQRLRRTAHDPRAGAATVLAAVEDATLYLRSRRLADELGTRALEVLAGERSVDGAPEVLRRISRLLAYYRTGEPRLPAWIESFAKTGYAHYCTLLPTAFSDEDATVRQAAAMLGFLFGMEGPALSLGCDRNQLELAVAQSHPTDPAKTALLWAAQVQLGRLSRTGLRQKCDDLPANPLVVPSCPATSAASCTRWNRCRACRTSWWKPCRTPSPGCRTRSCCPGCRR